jgi:uncharacterized protein YacL
LASQDKALEIWLSDIPATAVHRRRSVAIIGLMLAAFVVAASFASVHLPGNNAFIPIVQTVLFIGDLITAVLSRFWPKADIPSCTAHVRF